MKDFVCVLQEWNSCFSQSCGSPVVKSHWSLRLDSPWIPFLLSDLQAGKPDVGLRTFTTVVKLLWYYCSPVCGSPSWWVWDLILSWLHPSNCLVEVSPLFLNVGYPFLVGYSIVSSITSCIWCSHRREWAYVFVLHHLELILKFNVSLKSFSIYVPLVRNWRGFTIGKI